MKLWYLSRNTWSDKFAGVLGEHCASFGTASEAREFPENVTHFCALMQISRQNVPLGNACCNHLHNSDEKRWPLDTIITQLIQKSFLMCRLDYIFKNDFQTVGVM